MINDFIEYWTATRLLLHGGNPYAPDELFAAQRALGWTEAGPLLMWNPPWTLSLTLPFGLLDYETAQFLWFLTHVMILFVGGRILWKVYEGDPRKSRPPLLAVLTFAPGYFAVLLGQIGPLVLLGLIGFLASIKRNAWGWAGASLAVTTIKPHLLYLLWLALLVWIFRERRWRPALAFLGVTMGLAALPLLFNHDIYFQYFHLLEGDGGVRPLEWATPALGTVLAQIFEISGTWIRWLPGVISSVWVLWYAARRDRAWNWTVELPLVLLVSIATASFAWTFDHVVLLPAVVQGAVWVSQSAATPKRAIILGVHIILAVLLVSMKLFVRNDFWYFWAAPAYLLFFLYARAAMGAQKAGARYAQP